MQIALIPLASLPNQGFWDNFKAKESFLEFFCARIRNENTRAAYLQALKQFTAWCSGHGLELTKLTAVHIAAYIEAQKKSAPTIKLHLSAIRMFLDHLTVKGIIPFNPALSVKAPRFSSTSGKTPYFVDDEPKILLDSIETDTLIGLRDRAMMAVMLYTFARVSAVIALKVSDYFPQGKKWWLSFHEKGGVRHRVPASHKLEEALDSYIREAGIKDDGDGPLFRAANAKGGKLKRNGFTRQAAFQIIRRRCGEAHLPLIYGCHSFRATGITVFRRNGGSLEEAQKIAAHASSQTTKIYDRSLEDITLEAVERIRI